MDLLFRSLHVLVPAAWTAASAAYLFVFLREGEAPARWARRLALAAAILHLGEFAVAGTLGQSAFASGLPVASGMAIAGAVVYLFLERRIGRPASGVFVLAACTVMALVGAATADGRPSTATANLPPEGLAFHIAGATLGYAGLMLAALFGALYLLQFHALRAKRFGLFWERLPSLELLDQFTSASLGVATVFLTLTILLGHILNAMNEAKGPYWDAKIVATNLLWLVALVVTLLRRTHKLRAQPTAFASIGLFALALANLFVVNAFSRIHAGV